MAAAALADALDTPGADLAARVILAAAARRGPGRVAALVAATPAVTLRGPLWATLTARARTDPAAWTVWAPWTRAVLLAVGSGAVPARRGDEPPLAVAPLLWLGGGRGRGGLAPALGRLEGKLRLVVGVSGG